MKLHLSKLISYTIAAQSKLIFYYWSSVQTYILLLQLRPNLYLTIEAPLAKTYILLFKSYIHPNLNLTAEDLLVQNYIFILKLQLVQTYFTVAAQSKLISYYWSSISSNLYLTFAAQSKLISYYLSSIQAFILILDLPPNLYLTIEAPSIQTSWWFPPKSFCIYCFWNYLYKYRP